MLPASTTAAGRCLAVPDVCLTPIPAAGAASATPGPEPVAYHNLARPSRARNAATKVFFARKPVLTRRSQIPVSSGDEPGTEGGIVSGGIRQCVRYAQGSSRIYIEGHPCAFQGARTTHNGANANAPAGLQVSPSQSKVFVAM